MSFPGSRAPIVIPIPTAHLEQIDTLVTAQPCAMRIQFTTRGWDYYRKTIYPYIWQGYQVKLRVCPTTVVEDGHDSPSTLKIWQTAILDFDVRGTSGTTGSAGMFITYPANNTDTNSLIRWRNEDTNKTAKTLYTKDGVTYSYYSYVIYP